MLNLLARFAKDTRGATAIEYSLIASLIALAIITAVSQIGSKVTNTFNNVGNGMRGS
ncbi:MAG: Flp family type IVb pilin [Methylobacteriaceae bacterium]|nr:Flp family type IVb pilin [Methylobacteriaceae bacterium]MBV9220972.1 Flp family type IVb pilin [Methylobacteriaceae bacterium]MBV9243790.1 Flp family type IVb pilin [Methylobacteriaceae bacterium]MBV9637511.1 Flp family type IVb pilin [Methylobacteriaceae bacterium]